MSKEQNEVLEQQRYLLERRMYRLDPAPPRLPTQEYIVRYLIEKKEKYLTWYLHDQEPALSKLAQATCERFAMAEHFADIKQAAVCGILAALQMYDPAVGAPFAAFQKRYIQDGIDDYIRTAQSGVITMTADTYPVLRRIMAIYHLNGDDCSDSCMLEHKDEVVYFAHQYDTETAAMVCSCVIDELEKLYGEKFEYGQLLAAVKKLGIDHVYSPAFARAQSLTQAARLLDENLGKKPVLLTDNHAAKSFLRSHFPELEENFAFYDSKEKCFGDYMHEHHPGAKLISVSNNNSSGAEAAETGFVDYFINARELYRIIMRTGGRPSVKRPIEAEEIAEFEKCGRYAELFEAGGWYVDKPAEELEFTENGKRYKALICHNLGQVKAAVAKLDKYDVIKITA